MQNKRVRISKTRELNMYAELWRTSYWTMRQAEEKVEGSFFQIMASLIFTAFTLEAYFNHVGPNVYKCWGNLEHLSPQNKMNVIAEKLGIEIDGGKRPFQTVERLFRFRNAVAHGKSVTLKSPGVEIEATDSVLEKRMDDMLEAEWESYCTLDNAKRAREDVKIILKRFDEASGMKDHPLFFAGISATSATLIHD